MQFGVMRNNIPNKMQHAISLSIFSFGLVIINYNILVTDLLYRWAVNDLRNVAINMALLFWQFVLLYISIVFFQKRIFRIFIVIVFISALTNICYSQILGPPLNLAAVEWLLSEARQAGSAIHEFANGFVLSFIKAIIAIALFVYARSMSPWHLSNRLTHASRSLLTIAIFIIMFFVYGVAAYTGGSRGAELNLYRMTFDAITRKYPARFAVGTHPVDHAKVKKIIWLVDESIVYAQFHSLSGPMLSKIAPSFKTIDLGNAVSFANCSAQSNAAMRWGINVGTVNRKTDLRTTPTIWAYAKAAGFATTLIDGQVSGAPQNLVWPPERALIDQFIPALKGIDTDHAIAKTLNQMLKSDKKEFVYVVFRGAHYQYSSNYPVDSRLENGSLVDRYRRAIAYSKEKVFETIFQDLHRNDIAVFYTSDHGQVIQLGKVPHCNEVPDADEFSVPMLFIAPIDATWSNSFEYDKLVQHSASQIFPTALWLMGYSREYAEANYDYLLDKSPKAIVKFGKSIVPRSSDDFIQVKVYRSH